MSGNPGTPPPPGSQPPSGLPIPGEGHFGSSSVEPIPRAVPAQLQGHEQVAGQAPSSSSAPPPVALRPPAPLFVGQVSISSNAFCTSPHSAITGASLYESDWSTFPEASRLVALPQSGERVDAGNFRNNQCRKHPEWLECAGRPMGTASSLAACQAATACQACRACRLCMA